MFAFLGSEIQRHTHASSGTWHRHAHSGNTTVNTVSIKANKATCTKSVLLDSEKPFQRQLCLSSIYFIL